MILRSSFRVFNLLSFNTKHDMMHSRMTNQEQFERRHVRIDLHRIMDVCGYRQDWNNWHELRHNLTWWSIFCDSLFNHRPAYNNTYSPICPKKPLVSFSYPSLGHGATSVMIRSEAVLTYDLFVSLHVHSESRPLAARMLFN